MSTTIEVYGISELTGKAKDRALNWARENSIGYEASDITEQIKEYAFDKFGISMNTDCYWSLSYCQGDGVAFYGEIFFADMRRHDEELDRLVGILEESDVIVYGKSGQLGRYNHWNSMDITVECDSYTEEHEKTCLKIQECIKRILKEASRECEKFGYKIIDEQNSEEYLTEELENCGALFTQSGRFVQYA